MLHINNIPKLWNFANNLHIIQILINLTPCINIFKIFYTEILELTFDLCNCSIS